MTNPVTRRIKAAAVAVVATVGLAGCSHTPSSSWQGYCAVRATHVRIDDYRCDGGESLLYSWWYVRSTQYIPAIGRRATVGSFNRPSGKVSLGGAPTTGRTTTPKPAPTTTKKATPTTAKPNLKKSNGGGSKSGSSSRSGGGKR